MQQRAQALLLSEQRVELAQRMDRVMRSTDIAMEVQEVVMCVGCGRYARPAGTGFRLHRAGLELR